MRKLISKSSTNPQAQPAGSRLSLKHEQFVHRLVTGSSQRAAYQAIYPKASDSSAENLAWRLLRRPEVKAEIAHLLQRAEEPANLTQNE